MNITNIRVYGVILDDKELFDSSIVPNNEWIERAEKLGYVWTLKGFENDYNVDDIPHNVSIKII